MSNVLEGLQGALAGRYRFEREVGRGGMATVYLAQDLKHRRPVAVKVLHPHLAANVGADRFLREIEIAAGLNHPAHPHPYRLGQRRRTALLRHAVRRRRVAARAADPRGPAAGREAVELTRKVAGGARLRACARRRPPGRQARERDAARGRGDGHRLRHRQGAERRRRVAHADRHVARHARLHEPGAGVPASTRSTGGATSTAWAACSTRCSPASRRSPAPRCRRSSSGDSPSRPAPVRALRPEVPEQVERRSSRALARVPAERFAAASQFAQALAPAAGSHAAGRSVDGRDRVAPAARLDRGAALRRT